MQKDEKETWYQLDKPRTSPRQPPASRSKCLPEHSALSPHLTCPSFPGRAPVLPDAGRQTQEFSYIKIFMNFLSSTAVLCSALFCIVYKSKCLQLCLGHSQGIIQPTLCAVDCGNSQEAWGFLVQLKGRRTFTRFQAWKLPKWNCS